MDDGGTILADSNGILVYLASRYGQGQWLPSEPVKLALVQRWLSVAAGPVVNGPMAVRRAALFGAKVDVAAATEIALGLFRIMEGHLAENNFLAGEAATIADLACYSYIAHVPEGGISLDPFPHLMAWLARVEALPGFVPLTRTKIGLWA